MRLSLWCFVLATAGTASPLTAGIGEAAQLPSETARPADSFVDSIGVNTHLNYNATPYWTDFPAIKSALGTARFRHIRDSLIDPTSFPAYIPELQQLAAVGVHGTFYVLPNELNLPSTPQILQSFPSAVGSVFEAYEAPNEQDLNGGPNWVQNARAYQQQIWSAVKSYGPTANYPVLGPSLTRNSSYAALGDLSAYLDLGNMHDYLYGENPETTGAGLGGYGNWWGSIPFDFQSTGQVSGTKPVVATETAYCTGSPPSYNNVPLDVQTAYIPRLFLQSFNDGVARTWSYALIDDRLGSDYGYCGLLRYDLTPKPSYRIVANLIALFNDPGPPFGPGMATYALRGPTENVAHTLLQRRDGRFYLVLWNERPIWSSPYIQPGPPRRLQVPSKQIGIAFGPGVSRVTWHEFASSGRESRHVLPVVSGSVTVTVSPLVSVVEFRVGS